MKVAQSCLALCDPIDYTAHGIFQVRILELVPFPSPGDLPNPEIEPRFPALQADSLPAEPPRKPKNAGVHSLSLLQQIFPAQESNQGSRALQVNSLTAELPGTVLEITLQIYPPPTAP